MKEENAHNVQLAKERAEELEKVMREYSGREMSLALTNLEQAMMWCTKAIVLHDEKEQELNND